MSLDLEIYEVISDAVASGRMYFKYNASDACSIDTSANVIIYSDDDNYIDIDQINITCVSPYSCYVYRALDHGRLFERFKILELEDAHKKHFKLNVKAAKAIQQLCSGVKPNGKNV